VTLVADPESGAWTAVSAAPPIGPGGATTERLFTRLGETIEEDTPNVATARCPAYLEAGPDVALSARGVVTVDLVAEGEILRRLLHRVDLVVDPGTRSAELPWPETVEVDAADGRDVTCTVRYAPS
jgi:hypothetical protein